MPLSEKEKKKIESKWKKEHKHILRDEDIEYCDLQHLKKMLKNKDCDDLYMKYERIYNATKKK